MTILTSVVQRNLNRATLTIGRATSLVRTNGSQQAILSFITSAHTLITNMRNQQLVPIGKFPRTERYLAKAASVLGDYMQAISSVINVSIPPLQSASIAASEMQAIFNLVTSVNFTHRAVSNGNWTATGTWSPAQVPPEGARVYISAARNVRYNTSATTSIKTIRVDGTLSVARNMNTRLICDTIVVDHDGDLKINPTSAYTCSIEFKGGPIDTTWDPWLISRGLICHGHMDLHGAHKVPYTRLAGNPVSGVTKIVLASAQPTWKKNDKIIITPVRHQGFEPPNFAYSKAGPKVLYTIASINGVSITLDRATDRSFVIPTKAARASVKWRERSAYVANMTRNVVLRTYGTSVSIHRRGHTMIMHNSSDVTDVLFKGLGRTNKLVRAVDANVNLSTTSAKRNVKGRYPIHGHRAGLSGSASSVSYNVVSGAPGWGVGHHDSYMNLNYNVIYDVVGAGMVAEIGNEIGSWDGNLVCRTTSDVHHIPKDAEDNAAFDLARSGDAYFMMSRQVSVKDNIASGLSGWGYIYFHRFATVPVTQVSTQNIRGGDIKETMRYRAYSHPDQPEIIQFDNNEVFCAEGGFHVTKNVLLQGHSLRSWLTNFLAFEVRIGMEPTYTSRYTIKQCELIRADVGNDIAGTIGIWLDLTGDQVVASCRVRGFSETAIRGDLWLYPIQYWTSTDPEFFSIDNIIISTVSANYYGGNAAPYIKIRTAAQLSVNRLPSLRFSTSTSSFELSAGNVNGSTSAVRFKIAGSVTDSIGTTRYPVAMRFDGDCVDFPEAKVGGQLYFFRNAARRGYWKYNGQNQLVVREHYEDRWVQNRKRFRDIRISCHAGFLTSGNWWYDTGVTNGWMSKYPVYRGSITSNIHGTCITRAWTTST